MVESEFFCGGVGSILIGHGAPCGKKNKPARRPQMKPPSNPLLVVWQNKCEMYGEQSKVLPRHPPAG